MMICYAIEISHDRALIASADVRAREECLTFTHVCMCEMRSSIIVSIRVTQEHSLSLNTSLIV